MSLKHLVKMAILSFYCLAGNAATLPENHPVNGGLTIIPVDAKQKPEVLFRGHRVAVTESSNPNQWLLVVGLPLDSKNAIQQLQMVKPYRATIPFYMSDKTYKAQYLTIENKRKVDPLDQDQLRIANEKKKMANIFAHYSNDNPFAEGFKAPVNGPISSLFGLQRVYNKQPRDPHSGLDIAAKEGTPVKVISRGKVAATGNYFFTGNTVIVDHGRGVFSLYAHLKQIDVKKDQFLKQGDQVGIVGMTGRVTGPHLHWTMVMNQTLVDPLLFVSVKQITAVPQSQKKVEEKQDPKK